MTESIEEKAKAQGWTPLEDFKGDPDKWRSAEAFIKVGDNIQAVQSERNSKLLDDITNLKADMQELTQQQFKVIAEAKQRGYDKAVKDIESKQIDAVEDGDVEGYKKLEAEKKELEAPTVRVEQPKLDPVFVDWHQKNSWYKNNSADPISQAADTYGAFLAKTRQDLQGADFYKAVEKHIKTVFPDNFKKQPTNLDVDGQIKTSKAAGKKDYDSLPTEAKAACKLQVKKFGIKKEDYVKEYFKAYGE